MYLPRELVWCCPGKGDWVLLVRELSSGRKWTINVQYHLLVLEWL